MTRQDVDCALIAALMWGPKTRAQLYGEVANDFRTVDKVLRKLHHHGLIYRCGSVPPEMDADGNLRTGKWPVLWAFNAKPFAEPDRVTRHGTPIRESSICSKPSPSPANKSRSTSATPSSPAHRPTPTATCSTV